MNEKSSTWLSTTLLVVVTIVLGVAANGYTIALFWRWLILPVFTTLPTLTVVDAIGLVAVVRLFWGTREPKKDTRSLADQYTEMLVRVIMTNGVSIGVGWFLHLLRGWLS